MQELTLRGKPGKTMKRKPFEFVLIMSDRFFYNMLFIIRNVSAILVPIFGDQPRNAAMIEHNKLGKVSILSAFKI